MNAWSKLALVALALAGIGGVAWLSASAEQGRARAAASDGTNRLREVSGASWTPDAEALAAEGGVATDVLSGERDAVDPDLGTAPPSGPAILGTVLGHEGAPLGGARVWLFASDSNGWSAERVEPALGVTTKDDGRFRFPVASDARRAVLVDADGHAPKWRNQGEGVDAPFELQAAAWLSGDAGGFRVHGSVEWDGTALFPDGPWRRVDDGRAYGLAGCAVGRAVELSLDRDDCLPFVVEIEIPHAGEVVRDLRFGTKRIRGSVVDAADGRGIAGAALSGANALGERSDWVTGYGGSFAVDVAIDSAHDGTRATGLVPLTSVRIEAPDYVTLPSYPVSVLELTPVRLVPASRLDGRVLLDGGVPASGAKVELFQRGAFGEGGTLQSKTCDEDGRFTLTELPWGEHDFALEASHGELHRRLFGVAPLRPHEARELVITLSVRPAVDGLVRWRGQVFHPGLIRGTDFPYAEGAPELPPSRVRLVRVGDDSELEVVTDACGAFSFEDVAPGAYRLFAEDPRLPDSRSNVVELELREGENHTETLWYSPRKVALAGRILLPNGEPFANQTIDALPRSTGAAADWWWFGTTRGRTDSEGRFMLSSREYPDAELLLGILYQGASLTLVHPADEVGRPTTEAAGGLVHEGRPASSVEWRLRPFVPVRFAVPREHAESVRVSWKDVGEDTGGQWPRALPRATDGFFHTFLPWGVLEIEVSAGQSKATELVTIDPEWLEKEGEITVWH